MCFLGYLLFSLSVRGRERARLDARPVDTSRQPRSRFLSFPSLRCSHKKCFNKTNKLQKLQFNTVWMYLTLFWTVSKCYFFCFCFDSEKLNVRRDLWPLLLRFLYSIFLNRGKDIPWEFLFYSIATTKHWNTCAKCYFWRASDMQFLQNNGG